MSFTTQVAAQQRAANEQFERDCRTGLDAIYVSYPTLPKNMATDRLICDLVSQYMGEQTVPDLATFEMMLQNNPNCGLPVKAVDQQCAELIEEICDLLRSADGTGRDGKYSTQSLQTYRTQVLRFQSRDALLARKAEILEKQRLAKMTPAAIRAEQHKQDMKFISTQLPPEVTKEKLLGSVALMRFWLRSKGANAVNDRLNGRG